jgi:hypothetical protein
MNEQKMNYPGKKREFKTLFFPFIEVFTGMYERKYILWINFSKFAGMI